MPQTLKETCVGYSNPECKNNEKLISYQKFQNFPKKELKVRSSSNYKVEKGSRINFEKEALWEN